MDKQNPAPGSQNAASPPEKGGHAKSVASAAILIIVIIAVLAIFLHNSQKSVSPPTTSTALTTASTSVSSTSVSTTTIKQFNFTENVTINTIAINKSNVLFGVPNQQEFGTFGFNVTSGGDYTSVYGLNFTEPIMGGTTETNVTYSATIPAKYANATYPVSVAVTITTYTKEEASKVFYDWFMHYSNGTLYANDTGYLTKNASNGHILAMHVTKYPVSIGNVSTATDLYPMYSLDNYELAFLYNRDVVVINTFGIPHSFNYTYVDNMAQHVYGVLLNGS